MLLYAVIILICMALISAANIVLALPASSLGALGVIGIVTLSTVAVIALDGVVAFAVRRLPERWFRQGRPAFSVSRRECRLWRALGVRVWKDRIPELGQFTNFRKNKVYEPQNNEYIARFILECNYGVVIHFLNALLGPLIIFICPLDYALGVTLPVAAVNFVLSLLPLFALRYNTPKLEALYKINARREKKEKQGNKA